jgi:hypothetical protein
MRGCSPSSPTVNRGRARPLRLPLERASAPCSGRSTRLRQQAKCSRAVAGAVAFHREARFGADGGEDAVEDAVILGVVLAARTTNGSAASNGKMLVTNTNYGTGDQRRTRRNIKARDDLTTSRCGNRIRLRHIHAKVTIRSSGLPDHGAFIGTDPN